MNRISRRRAFLSDVSSTLTFPRKSHAHRKPKVRHNAAPAHRWRRPQIERLEDRSLLASVFWDGGGTTSNWSDRFNWTGDTVPGTSDVAVVDQFVTLTVTLDTDASVAGLQVGGAAETQTFDASNHNLTVSGGARVFAHGAITFANT